MRGTSVLARLIVVVCSLLAPLTTFAQSKYTLIDLGTLGAYRYTNGALQNVSSASALNNTGQVVGSSTTSSSFSHAFLYSGGVMTDLGTPLVTDCGTAIAYSGATGINDSGQVLGFSLCSDGSQITSWIWANGTVTQVPGIAACPTYFWPTGINANSSVTGFTCLETNTIQAAISDDVTTRGLGVLARGLSVGTSINSSGQVTGYTDTSSGTHAFLYSQGVMSDLGTLGGTRSGYPLSYSQGQVINDSGQVGGESIAADSTFHAFLMSSGVMKDLGAIRQGYDAYVGGMNNVGQTVGYTQSIPGSNNPPFAWLYTAASGFLDLNTLVPGGSGWVLFQARAVNDNAQIAANGFLNNSQNAHSVLLSPAGYTPAGTNVFVQPTDSLTGMTPVSLTFSEVSQGGETTLSMKSTGPPPPNGFKLGQPATYFDISTTAAYSGSIKICINYLGVAFNQQSNIAIWHYDDSLGSWTKLATTNDAANSTACANTPSLSPFALFEIAYSGQVQQPINPDNSSVFSTKKGVVPVKFTLTTNGAGTCALPAANIALTRTAGGTLGSVDESTYTMAADSGTKFRIDSGNCQYVYNLAAGSLGSGTYRVDIIINGYVVGSGVFGLQ